MVDGGEVIAIDSMISCFDATASGRASRAERKLLVSYWR